MRKSTIAFLALLLVVTAQSPFAQEAKHTQVAQRSERSRSFISAPGREAITKITIAQPYAHYPLDGDALDVCEKNLHGYNAEGKPAIDRFGKVDRALEFDGVNDFLLLPINISPSKFNQLTLCAWVKPHGKIDHYELFSQDNSVYDRAIAVRDKDCTRQWIAYGGDGKEVIVTTEIKYDTWYFVAVCYDQAGGTVRLHVNDRSTTQKGRCGEGNRRLAVSATTRKFRFHPGTFDDIRIYDTALSPEAIQEIYSMEEE